jgi:gamma-glutamyltranspeptidase/glutathione hydrolase
MVQVFLNVVEFGLDPQAAIEAPRVVTRSFQNSFWPHVYQAGRVDAETRIPEAVRAELAARGHDVHANHPWGGVSLVCAVAVDQATGVLAGGADPRGDCYVAGW